jgi:formylglycine-generating enzyme required for sulfatase activity
MKEITYEQLTSANKSSRDSYLTELAKEIGSDFDLKDSETRFGQLPCFTHVRSGLEFTLIPGGEVNFGLSQQEEDAARRLANPPPFEIAALRPVSRRRVSPFLITSGPIPISAVVGVLGEHCLSEYDRQNGEPEYPAYLKRDHALDFAGKLSCRFPTELEWEYACRAHTATLFPWGDVLPTRQELANWLDLENPPTLKRNAFGLYGLFSGDWCEDAWTASHDDSATPLSGSYVIKGGGSVFWPWQDSGEWKWCMPAGRMPSSGLINGRCAFRLVYVQQ